MNRDKLEIASRSNGEKKVYIKLKAKRNAMRIMEQIFTELGVRDQFDSCLWEYDKKLTPYSSWIDEFNTISTPKFTIDIIYGSKYIHMIVQGKNPMSIIQALERHTVWVKPTLRKKVRSKRSS